IPPHKGIMFRALREGAAQIVRNAVEDPAHYTKIGHESNLEIRSMLAVPLMAGEKSMGVLVAVSRHERRFSEEDRDLLVTMAGYIAIAIENTHLFEQVQNQTRELERKVAERTNELEKLYQRQAALAKIELAINQPHELQRVLDQIVKVTAALLPVDGGATIYLWDQETETFSAGSSSIPGYDPESLVKAIRNPGGAVRRIVDRRQPFSVEDAQTSSFKVSPFVTKAGFRSYAGVPLIAEGNVLGVLIAASRQPRKLTTDEMDYLMALANRAANAITKVKLYEAERRQRARAEARAMELREREGYLAMLNDITRTAIEQHDLQTMLQLIANRLGELFGADGCFITLWDNEGRQTLPAAAHSGQNEHYVKMKVDPGETTITDHIARHFPTSSLLTLPLIAGDQKLGAALVAFNEPRHFTEYEISLGEQAAGQIALAIAKIRALETAQRRAREAETLRQAGAIVAETLQQDEAIDRILFQLERVIPYDSASVQLLQNGYMEIVGGRGWPEEEVILGVRFPIPGNNPNTVVVQERRPHILNDAPKIYSTFTERPHHHLRSWLGVPLIVRDVVIGMLASLSPIKWRWLSKTHACLKPPKGTPGH
ncbi:MAG: GAF domain-containing protein, partial [Anaerolineales bacterium]